jgi:translation elongation factor EF-4
MHPDGIHKGKEYPELIDTPGGFSYEVSRSIAACEGAFDCRCSTKYTGSNISNLYLALENDLEIILF